MLFFLQRELLVYAFRCAIFELMDRRVHLVQVYGPVGHFTPDVIGKSKLCRRLEAVECIKLYFWRSFFQKKQDFFFRKWRISCSSTFVFLGLRQTLLLINHSLWDTTCMGMNKPHVAPLIKCKSVWQGKAPH